MFEAVLIANRGEIARRIIRTLRRLGIRAVTVHSPGDVDAPHVREGDESIPLPGYLDIAALVDACRHTGAGALHPGYGFLSENPTLARACTDAGITFIGPPAAAMEMLGDKIAGKSLAHGIGVPVVPAFTEEDARSGAATPIPCSSRPPPAAGVVACASSRRPASSRTRWRLPGARLWPASATTGCSSSASSPAPVTSRCR